ncbi:MAG: MFS transporter [Clostridiales bacterium]|nr:MFS transporter [Clostridiales bacterium]
MEQELEVKRNIGRFAAFTVLLIPFVYTFENAAIGPALGVISQAFPGASLVQVQYVMNIPFITVIPVSIIAGNWLVYHFDKRKIVIIGLFIYAISGFAPGFVNDINTLLLLRVLTGIGAGLVMPVPNMMISEIWGGVTREKRLGIATSVQCISSMSISIIAGFVAALSWRYVFYCFIIILVIAIISLIGLPKFPAPSKEEVLARKTNQVKVHIPPRVWIYGALMCGNWVLWSFPILNIAIYGEKFNITGGALGILMALFALFSIPAAAFYSQEKKVLKRFLPTVAVACYGAGFLIFFFANNYAVMVVGALFCALGSSSMNPHIFDLTARACASDLRAREISFGIVTPCIALGGLIAPLIQAGIGAISGNTSIESLFFVTAIALFVFAVILIFTTKERVKEAH